MYIVDSRNKQIINSDFVERFCVVEKDDTVLIVASYGDLRQPVTIGRYRESKEAQDTLGRLLDALAYGRSAFHIPDSD